VRTTLTNTRSRHTHSTYQTCPYCLFSSLSLALLSPSPHPPFLLLYSSHCLCSAHSKDLLKKLSLEVSLLPKYPICAAALTPHTRNCICTYTPQMVSLLDLPPAEPRQAITTHKHTSSPLHLFFCYLLLFALFCTVLPCPHGCILHKGMS
jgi:hypothetical protein